MKKLVLTIAIAALMVACKKENEVKPNNPNQPPVQEEYDCDSHPAWYIQVYQDCNFKGASKHLISNQESKRIDSLFSFGDCVKINFKDVQNDSMSGYWLAPMYDLKASTFSICSFFF